MKKSQFFGFLLTLFFGPFGLLYPSVIATLTLIFVGILVGLLTLGLGAIVVWPVSIFVGFFTVHRWNNKLSSLLEANREMDNSRVHGRRVNTA